MQTSALWFLLLLVIAGGCLAVGAWLGSQRRAVRIASLVVALLALAAAASLRFNPVALHTTLLPLSISIWLEGLVPVFPWMLLTGVILAMPVNLRLRRTGVLMAVLGLVYFGFGGIWMALPDIRPMEREVRTARNVTLQTRPDTCVPAACATALRAMGVPATEAEMCAVVMARPGRGSTLARAAYGLQSHLDRHGIEVSLENLDADEVVWTARSDRPVLVVIRSNITADHMVVVLGTFGYAVGIANPSPGEHGGEKASHHPDFPGVELFTTEQFGRLYRDGAIVFRKRRDRTERSPRRATEGH